MTSTAGALTKMMILGALGIAALTWTTRAQAAVSCDGSWTDDRGQSNSIITFPNSGSYSPAEILINPRQMVTWEGNTASDTFQKYPLVDASGKLWGTFSVNEQSWPFTYTRPGAWEYNDANDTSMAGIVCVEGPPIASFTHSPSPAKPNQTVTFDASGSHVASCCAASITDYQWDLGTGTFTDNGATATTSHSFTAPGIYTIRLKVRDNLGSSSIQTEQVAIGAVITRAAQPAGTTATETSKGAAPLRVENPNSVSANGKVTLTGSSSSGLGQIGSTGFTVPGKGTATVNVPLSSAARMYLKHHKSLSVKATVVLSRNGTSQSGTWMVTIDRA